MVIISILLSIGCIVGAIGLVQSIKETIKIHKDYGKAQKNVRAKRRRKNDVPIKRGTQVLNKRSVGKIKTVSISRRNTQTKFKYVIMPIIYMRQTIEWFQRIGEPINIDGMDVTQTDTHVKLTPIENG